MSVGSQYQRYRKGDQKEYPVDGGELYERRKEWVCEDANVRRYAVPRLS